MVYGEIKLSSNTMGKCWKTNCSATERWWYANGKIIIAQANIISVSNRIQRDFTSFQQTTIQLQLKQSIYIKWYTHSAAVSILNILLMFCRIQSVCLVSFGVSFSCDLSCAMCGVYGVKCVYVCAQTTKCALLKKCEERLQSKNDDTKAKQKASCSFRTAFHLYCFPNVNDCMSCKWKT